MKITATLSAIILSSSVIAIGGLESPNANACTMKPSSTRPGKYYNDCTMEYYEPVPNSSSYTYGGGSNPRLRPANTYSDGYSTGDYGCGPTTCFGQ